MTPLTHLFISKHRKVHFDISVVIRDLVNIPLVSGLFFVSWRIKNASNAYGVTARIPIKDHTVGWNEPIKVLSQLVISKQRLLGPCELKLEVFQELGGKQVSSIGDLTINLSEYVGSGLTTERFLLNHSKFNSTLKLAIKLHQKSDPGVEFEIPTKKKQFSSSIPSFIIERKGSSSPTLDDKLSGLSDSHSVARIQTSTNRGLRKSQSTMTLKYCRQNTLPSNFDCPSPQDVVEQLFAH
ncbi:N-terminal C2 in EEIG1 and EHBP1 proteins-domain-containing protein [Absidia repens]|uniref:N-terminal C2 in EEIG1 and EHBP1 proteins-domain-containing protein n=1 Tax=Absidia repens TaxID=90262 RepID=A0A1X2I578_9FUNG|nr:N-terminal C2 in EEIG1 and EHBP1 proteins-domain-containing protein [Absidia repens]